MREEIANIKNQAISQLMEAKSLKEIEQIRAQYLGKKGKLAKIIKGISNLKDKDRRHAGILINETKKTLAKVITEAKQTFKEQARDWFDPTIPGQKPSIGHYHLVTQAINKITDIFKSLGFTRVRYPEVDWDWYAFEGLNFPPGHPARDDWETYWVDTSGHKKYGAMLLTPHTSNGQIREMVSANHTILIRLKTDT